MDNDFYIVLPSNSCADTHPDNNASKYTVSWQNPMQFLPSTDHWKVALTELNYLSTKMSVNAAFGVRYTKLATTWYYETVELVVQAGKKHKIKTMQKDVKAFPVTVEYDDEQQKLKITSGKLRLGKPFKVIFETLEQANNLGFDDIEMNSVASQKYEQILESVDAVEKVGVYRFRIATESGKFPVDDEVYIEKEKSYAKAENMINDIASQFKNVFEVFTLTDEGKTTFRTFESIVKLKFLNNFHYALGYWESEFDKPYEEERTAEFKPKLDMGFSNMYIYASICSPIQVGSVKVPLLRSIWIRKHKPKVGEMQKVTIKNPMYLKVSSVSVNKIDINIRTDSGSFVPFPTGAKTSMTLHFKRVPVLGGNKRICSQL